MTNKYQVLRPLTPPEYASLKNSIRESGVTAPIITDEDGNIIDGHHRQRIYNELQAEGVSLPALPKIVKIGLTEEQKINLAYELNITGRQLTPAEIVELRSRAGRRKAVEQSLRQSPHMADNWHAQQTGVSDKTIRVIRENLESISEIPKCQTLITSDGREYPRKQLMSEIPKLNDVERKSEPEPIGNCKYCDFELYKPCPICEGDHCEECCGPDDDQDELDDEEIKDMEDFLANRTATGIGVKPPAAEVIPLTRPTKPADEEYARYCKQVDREHHICVSIFEAISAPASLDVGDIDEAVRIFLAGTPDATPEQYIRECDNAIRELTNLKQAFERCKKLKVVKT